MTDEVKEEREGKGRSRAGKWLKGILLAFLGLWAVVIIALQLLLSSAFLTKVVNRLADRYVDGTVTFSDVKASMFKSFPNLNVSIGDFSLTYPHDRFAAYDSVATVSDSLRNLGRGTEMDTLAHFDRLSVSVNYMDLIRKKLNIRHVVLEHPRVFAHRYDSTATNWKMFKLEPKESDSDSTLFSMPVSVGKVSLADRPFAVFTDLADTLSGTLHFKEMSAKGHYDAVERKLSRVNFSMDSLFVAGRLPSDTLALALDHLGVKEHGPHYDIDLESKAYLALRSAGRMEIPLSASCEFTPDFQKKLFEVKDLKASVATIDLTGEGLVDMSLDSMYVKADVAMEDEPVSDVTKYFGENFPVLKKLKTDALLSADGHCDGYYDKESGRLPKMFVHLTVPESHIGWKGIDETGRFDLEATASTRDGKLVAEVQDLCMHVQGANVQLKGSADDILGGDPLVSMDGDVHLRLDSLTRFLPEDSGISARGNLDGNVKGEFKVSELDIYNFSDIGIEAALKSNGIRIYDPKDTLTAYLGKTTINLKPDAKGKNVVSAAIDSIFAEYGKSTFIRGKKVALSASNSTEKIKGLPGRHPLVCKLEASSVNMMDLDSCFVGVSGTSNTLKFTPTPKGKETVPYLNLSSSNQSLTIRESVNRYSAAGVALNVAAHPVAADNKARRKHLLDSLQKVYPGVPRDSLFFKAFSQNRRAMPDYLTEKDFRKKDIQISLGESVAKYIQDWDISGNLKASSGKVITPYYPLENTFTSLNSKFTNNSLTLSGITINSGQSDISANGTLTGLKRALTSKRGGLLNLNLNLNSSVVDVNEILLAVNAGKQFVPPGENVALTGVDDKTYLNAVKSGAVVDTSARNTLLVLPANLNAKVAVQANTVRWSSLETSFLSTSLEMKERCLQATNTFAMTNMGEAFLEGFYSTRTKKDLKAGFDLMLSNITAEKVIELFPAVDSIMPMLKAFKGLLDCEMAATSSLDTDMNLILPSVTGIVKIDGKNLSLSESEDLDKLRKSLRFKDRDSSYIDAMSVRGIINNDQLEIFPFILDVDRYTVALSGIQQFDQKFKYHVAAIKSPVPFKFGVNLKGMFSDWRWKLGKAKFKSTKIPLFDDQVDGVRVNLVNSIHNIFERGVEQAIKQNEQAQAAIESKKAAESYSAEETEELTEAEKQELNAAEAVKTEAAGSEGTELSE